jgi:hypothetical protein
MPDAGLLDKARALIAQDSGLAVAVTCRADRTPHASVVNAGVLDHPVNGTPIVGFVARGHARKLDNIRTRPEVTIVWRVAWEWVAVDGRAQLVGPTDPIEGLTPADLPRLLRSVYAAAVGGTEHEWASLDEEMEREGHTAVLISPTRLYSNPGAGT